MAMAPAATPARGPLSLTGWLDPALKYFADQAGISVEDYSSRVGGEGIGTAIEVLADLFSKGWLNKVIQVVAGLMASGYGTFGKDVPSRLRKELITLGTHELLRFVDPKPSELIEFRRSIDDFIDALRRGDMEGMKAAVFRSPSEWQAMLAAMGVPVGRIPSPAVLPPRTSTVVKPPTATGVPPTPAPAPRGKYQITD